MFRDRCQPSRETTHCQPDRRNRRPAAPCLAMPVSQQLASTWPRPYARPYHFRIVHLVRVGMDDPPVLAAKRVVVQPRHAAHGHRGNGDPRRATTPASARLPGEPGASVTPSSAPCRHARSPRPTRTSTPTSPPWRTSSARWSDSGGEKTRPKVPPAAFRMVHLPQASTRITKVSGNTPS
jgi:hypothetical protein